MSAAAEHVSSCARDFLLIRSNSQTKHAKLARQSCNATIEYYHCAWVETTPAPVSTADVLLGENRSLVSALSDRMRDLAPVSFKGDRRSASAVKPAQQYAKPFFRRVRL